VADNEASLVVRSGPFVGPVLSRVVGMIAARAQCPVDRLDDAFLLADAVADHAGPLASNGRVAVNVSATDGTLVLRVGPLRTGGAAALVAAAELPGVGNVLERIADDVTPEAGGTDGLEYVSIRLGFGSA
jgi:serine/threonine-protein kinase RsbW